MSAAPTPIGTAGPMQPATLEGAIDSLHRAYDPNVQYSATFEVVGQLPAPAPQPTLAEVLAAVARLEGKVDRLLQAQAAKPAAGGYKTL